MRKLFIAILALVLAAGLACSALAASVHAVADPTYVRTGPGLDYEIVDNLSPGNYYTYAGTTSYDSRGIAWYDVNYDGKYGWVSSLHANLSYDDGITCGPTISPYHSYNTKIYSKGCEVNVRSGPGAVYAKIGTMYPGDSFDFTGYTKNGFYQIVFYNQKGWVSTYLTYKN